MIYAHGHTFEAHSLQMILGGPLFVRAQYGFGIATNGALTIGAVCGKVCVWAWMMVRDDTCVVSTSHL